MEEHLRTAASGDKVTFYLPLLQWVSSVPSMIHCTKNEEIFNGKLIHDPGEFHSFRKSHKVLLHKLLFRKSNLLTLPWISRLFNWEYFLNTNTFFFSKQVIEVISFDFLPDTYNIIINPVLVSFFLVLVGGTCLLWLLDHF